jgi:hypothetical protein
VPTTSPESSSPPPFGWEDWYAAVGGRSINIEDHKEWARDFDGFATKLFPTVLMPAAPPLVDPRAVPVHWYPKLARS